MLGIYAAIAGAVPLFSAEELEHPQRFAAKFDSVFKVVEMPIARYRLGNKQIILHNSYASSTIKNPYDWKPDTSKMAFPFMADQLRIFPDSICLVLSKYPQKREDWITNYYSLLASRLKALYAIAPELNDASLPHTLILQTAGESEEEAISLFHGFIIYAHKNRGFQKETGNFSNAREWQSQDSLLQLDSSYMPESNICFFSGSIYDVEIYRNEVWISWEEGIRVSRDTFIHFEARTEGLDSSRIKDLCVFQGHLFGQDSEGTVWKRMENEWVPVYTPTNRNQRAEGLVAGESVMIAVYEKDEFLVTTDGRQFVRRVCKQYENGQWKPLNLSPGNFLFRHDSILFTSGNRIYLSTDNLLNTREYHRFPMNEIHFISGMVIRNDVLYVLGWINDGTASTGLSYRLRFHRSGDKHWGSIRLPARGKAAGSLYAPQEKEDIWITGLSPGWAYPTCTYFRQKDSWSRMEVPGDRVLAEYAGFYIYPYSGGNIILLPEYAVPTE